MRKLIALFCLFPLLVAQAFAQSSPGLNYGQVPTPAQWNSYFQAKQDVLGYTPLNIAGGTMQGPLFTTASTAAQAGLRVPPGIAPSSPVNGDFWSTSAGFFGQANGVTYGPFTEGTSGSFTGSSPIVVSFPGGGVVNYAFDFTVANTFLAQQIDQGATTTSPGWYAQLTGDTQARVRVGLNATDIPSIALGPGGSTPRDAFIERVGAGALRFGAPDAAAPVAQSLSVQNVVAGTSNTAGANVTINGSQGTGTGLGGSIIFQVAPAGLTGTAQNALAAALTLDSTKLATFAGHLVVEGVTSTGATGTGKFVFSTSPTLTTPALGVATGTSLALNGCTLSANALCATGTAAISSTLTSAAHAITSASANALTAGLNGATNPAFNVDASTALQVAGLNVKGDVTGGTVAVSVIDSGSNANLTINAKGTGTIGIGSVSTGAVTITPATTLSGALTYGGVTLSNAVTGAGKMVLGTAPTIAGGSITGLTGLAVRDTSAAFDVTLAATSSVALTAGRTLTIDMVNAARTLKLGANLTLATDPGAVTGALKSNGTGTFGQAACADLSNGGNGGCAMAYAEGTWTPSIIGSSTAGTGQTYTAQVGSYEQIGRMVVLHFTIYLSSVGTASGNALISGLPFAAVNTTNDNGNCTINTYVVAGLAALNYGMGGVIAAGASIINIQSNGNTASNNVTIAQLGATGSFIGVCIYKSS